MPQSPSKMCLGLKTCGLLEGSSQFTNITMVIVSPLTGVNSPSKWPAIHGLQMGGVLLTTYKSWDDPPSVSLQSAVPSMLGSGIFEKRYPREIIITP